MIRFNWRVIGVLVGDALAWWAIISLLVLLFNASSPAQSVWPMELQPVPTVTIYITPLYILQPDPCDTDKDYQRLELTNRCPWSI